MISKLQKFTEGLALDILGVAIVVSASIAMGYHETVIAGVPIGIFSTVGAAFSMMATRLVTKRNNLGNLIGVLTTVNTTIVDYYLGNQAALLTYPVSFFGNLASFWFWRKKGNRTPRKFDQWYFVNAGIATIMALVLNYIGFSGYLSHAIQDSDMAKFWVTTIITALTFSGMLNMPRMYADTWGFYEVYNGFKLYQNILFGNIAYVAKYIFYIVNAFLGWIVWHQVRKRESHAIQTINNSQNPSLFRKRFGFFTLLSAWTGLQAMLVLMIAISTWILFQNGHPMDAVFAAMAVGISWIGVLLFCPLYGATAALAAGLLDRNSSPKKHMYRYHWYLQIAFASIFLTGSALVYSWSPYLSFLSATSISIHFTIGLWVTKKRMQRHRADWNKPEAIEQS